MIFADISPLRNVELLNRLEVADSGEVDVLQVVVLNNQVIGVSRQ